MVQLTVEEQGAIDDLSRQGNAPLTIHKKINAKRRKRDISPADKTTIYWYLDGGTHKKRKPETRGREETLTNADLRKLQQARWRLLKKADGEFRVTYKEIIEEAGLLTSAPNA